MNRQTDKLAALIALTGLTDGNVNDLEVAWLKSVVSDPTIDNRNDLWAQFMVDLGFLTSGGNVNDALYAFLGDQGYTGSMDDRWDQYWAAGGGGGGPDPLIATNIIGENTNYYYITSGQATDNSLPVVAELVSGVVAFRLQEASIGSRNAPFLGGGYPLFRIGTGNELHFSHWVYGVSVPVTPGSWHLFCWNTRGDNVVPSLRAYRDDTLYQNSNPTSNDTNILGPYANSGVKGTTFAYVSNGNNLGLGLDMCYLGVWEGYTDFSVEANRRKFFTADGKLVPVNTSTWDAFGGSQPLIWSPTGDLANDQQGSIGALTAVGTFTHPTDTPDWG